MSPVGDPAQPRAATPSVLLVGDVAFHFEADFAAIGLTCTVAATAASAVAWMRAAKIDVVVVPPTLPDMAVPVFAVGLLQHFPHTHVLLYALDIKGEELSLSFERQQRVVHVPAQTGGTAIADYIVRRAEPAAPAALPSPLPSLPADEPPPGPAPYTGDLIAMPDIVVDERPGSAPAGFAAIETLVPSAPAPSSLPPPLASVAPPASVAPVATITAVSLAAPLGVASSALAAPTVAEALLPSAVVASQSNVAPSNVALAQSNGGPKRTSTSTALPPLGPPPSALPPLPPPPKGTLLEPDARPSGNELGELQARISAAEWALSQEKQNRAELDRELFNVREQLKRVERERDAIAAQRDELRVDFETTKSALDDGFRGDNELRTQLEQVRHELADSQKATAIVEQVKIRLATDVLTARGELARQKTATDEQLARNQALSGEKAALVADAAKQKEAHTALEEKAAAIAATARRLAADLKTQQEATHNAVLDRGAANARIGELERQIERDGRAHANVVGERDGFLQERDELRFEVQRLETEAAPVRQKLADEMAAGAALTTALATSKADAQALREDIEQKRMALADERRATDNERKALQKTATDATQKMEDALKKSEEMRKLLDEARQVRDDAELQSTDVELQLVAVKQQLETATRQATALSGELLAVALAEIERLNVVVENGHAAALVVKTAQLNAREAADVQALETRLDNVSRERDRAIAALTEASRKLMELEDRIERPGAR